MLRILQWVGFIFLSCVSFFFTCNLALGLGMDRTEKAALVAGSLAIEILKMYALIAANTYAHSDRTLAIHRRRTVLMYGAYIFVACYSLAACFGFSLATVDRMTAATTLVGHIEDIAMEDKVIATYDDAINNVKKGLTDKQQTLANIPQDRITRMAEVQKMIVADQAKMDDYLSKKETSRKRITAWKQEDQYGRSTQKRSMYAVVGDTTGLSTKWVAFFVLAVFSLAIELGVFVTSPHGDVPLRRSSPPEASCPEPHALGGASTGDTPAFPIRATSGHGALADSGPELDSPLPPPTVAYTPDIRQDTQVQQIMHDLAEAVRSLQTHTYQHRTPCNVCEKRIDALAAYDEFMAHSEAQG